MNDHIVIIGSKVDSTQHLVRLISECRREPETATNEIVLLSDTIARDQPGGLPSALQEFDVK